MQSYGRTDIGFKRNKNEDFIFTSCVMNGKFENLHIVADGVGGNNAGEMASKFAVTKFVDIAMRCGNVKICDILKKMWYITKNVNEDVYVKSKSSIAYNKMCTTLVACTVKNNVAYIINVGDSRAYKVNDSQISKITIDHNIKEELKRINLNVRDDELKIKKNALTRAIGLNFNVVPDIYECRINKGETLLLCSDGLTNYVDEKQIHKICIEHKPITLKVDRLIELANLQGGYDNVSVVIIEN